MTKKKIAIICGGPSGERGISLNSARSLFDNLDRSKYELSLLYYNPKLEVFELSESQIYSNTPLDFDYKLKSTSKSLSEDDLANKLKNIDLVFPVIHGVFGEDGQLQAILEKLKVKYIGSNPTACINTANKHLCQEELKKAGFYTIENFVVKKGDELPKLENKKYVVKPLHGGSSIGVEYIQSPDELNSKVAKVFRVEEQAIIEPYCEGKEFTIIVLENSKNDPVALLPTEIEFLKDKFFDYRKKYLASPETRYHTPARYSEQQIKEIQKQAEKAFKALNMKDFARMDGWILDDGTIWFNDINAISGMEQNSFVFQSAAVLGLNHKQFLEYLIEKKITKLSSEDKGREVIPILFGGNTAERQVSVMSGTNIWIKLKTSEKYLPIPHLLSREGGIYKIPHILCLHHTVEEIEEKINDFKKEEFVLNLKKHQKILLEKLKINEEDIEEKIFTPIETNLLEISKNYKFIFLGLHGGDGENGKIQKELDELGLKYNGSGANASALCMDKFRTGQKIEQAQIKNVSIAKKRLASLYEEPDSIWQELKKDGFGDSIIIKPHSDGCSAGVIAINNLEEFKKAFTYYKSDNSCIPANAIHSNHGQIELPNRKLTEVLIEKFIFTDKVMIKDMEIEWESINDLIEVTIGVYGQKNKLVVMNPSQTIASSNVLSLEEKFMGGTGINFTPPPTKYVKPSAVEEAKTNLKKVAELLEIQGYARLDTFMNIKTGELTIIEANTLPGMTASTVIYHQALAETPSMKPLEFIEKIIELGKTHVKD